MGSHSAGRHARREAAPAATGRRASGASAAPSAPRPRGIVPRPPFAPPGELDTITGPLSMSASARQDRESAAGRQGDPAAARSPWRAGAPAGQRTPLPALSMPFGTGRPAPLGEPRAFGSPRGPARAATVAPPTTAYTGSAPAGPAATGWAGRPAGQFTASAAGAGRAAFTAGATARMSPVDGAGGYGAASRSAGLAPNGGSAREGQAARGVMAARNGTISRGGTTSRAGTTSRSSTASRSGTTGRGGTVRSSASVRSATGLSGDGARRLGTTAGRSPSDIVDATGRLPGAHRAPAARRGSGRVRLATAGTVSLAGLSALVAGVTLSTDPGAVANQTASDAPRVQYAGGTNGFTFESGDTQASRDRPTTPLATTPKAVLPPSAGQSSADGSTGSGSGGSYLGTGGKPIPIVPLTPLDSAATGGQPPPTDLRSFTAGTGTTAATKSATPTPGTTGTGSTTSPSPSSSSGTLPFNPETDPSADPGSTPSAGSTGGTGSSSGSGSLPFHPTPVEVVPMVSTMFDTDTTHSAGTAKKATNASLTTTATDHTKSASTSAVPPATDGGIWVS